MNSKFLLPIALFSLCLMLLVGIQSGRSSEPIGDFAPSTQSAPAAVGGAPAVGCADRPSPNPRQPDSPPPLTAPLTLDRFRQQAGSPAIASTETAPESRPARPERLTLEFLQQSRLNPPPVAPSDPAVSSYRPPEEIALADPTNYGNRYLHDLQGKPAENLPIVVLHETVFSASSAINFFQTPHPRDEDQASYHTLIKRDGTVVYIVPPDKRAFGAGNSVFESAAGPEAVQTNPRFSASVNNFAYHISLETPPDGANNGTQHSGYSRAQYQSLAWLIARTNVPDDRLTTHRLVDRSGSRIDPRSFDFEGLGRLLASLPRTPEITIGCPVSSS